MVFPNQNQSTSASPLCCTIPAVRGAQISCYSFAFICLDLNQAFNWQSFDYKNLNTVLGNTQALWREKSLISLLFSGPTRPMGYI